MSEYQWRPVDRARKEIRVLDLGPGTGTESLGGQLRHVFLDESDKPEYETISYAWGDYALVDSISVDSKRIPIPASAASALRCMRLPTRTRTLWIDCICIDQNNDHEKGHQVGLMADIFQSSCETLAHLGDDVDNTAERGFWGLQVVCNAWIESKTSNYGERVPKGQYGHDTSREIRHWSSLRKRIDLAAIKTIISRPYFKRLWVVQEVVLSARTTLCCDRWTIDMHSLILAAWWLIENPLGFAENDIYEAKRYAEVMSFFAVVAIADNHDDLSLGAILLQGVQLQCSEPLDRIFGFFGILRFSTKTCPIPAYLAPDYTKSVVDVYCDTTRFCISEGNQPWLLDEFGYHRSSDNLIQGLPTWVPNWLHHDKKSFLTGLRLHSMMLPEHAELWSEEHHSAITPLVPGFNFGKVLSIRGVVLETISNYSRALLTIDVAECIAFVINAFQLLSNEAMPACIRSKGRERLCRLTRVLGAGRLDARLTLSLRECLRLEFPDMDFGTDTLQGLTTQSAEQSRLNDILLVDPDGRSITAQELAEKSLREGAANCCVGRRAFSTQSGRLGIGTMDLQDGDVIVVSKLSRWPMILRRAESSGPDHYTVVGHAFVEGIHNGEEIFAAADDRDELGIIHLV